MIYRRLLFLLAFCIACKPAPQQAPAKPAAGPQVKAVVVTIRTTLQPANRTHNHDLVIAGDRARSTGELDVWRIFDLGKDSVTFVDDTAKTYRTESLQSLRSKRAATLAQPLRRDITPAKWESTKEQQTLQGVTATKSAIRAGNYVRELWLAKHPHIPDELFAMMEASDAPSTPLAPMMRKTDEALIATRGFPLLDRAELPYGDKKMTAERTVVTIVEKQVPATMLEVPRGYRNLTPKQ